MTPDLVQLRAYLFVSLSSPWLTVFPPCERAATVDFFLGRKLQEFSLPMGSE